MPLRLVSLKFGDINLTECFVSWIQCSGLSLSLLALFGTTRLKSVAYFACYMCYYGLNQAIIISSVDVLLTRSHFTSHNFFSTAKKIIYIACSIQADFWLVKILTLSNPHKSSRQFGGGAQGSSPTVAGNRAYIFWFWNHLTPVLNTRASHFNTWNTSNRSCLRCQAPMMTKVVSYCSMLIVIYY